MRGEEVIVMPIIKSAQKQLRQDKKRSEHNDVLKNDYKSAIRTVEKLAEAGKKVTDEAIRSAYGKIDKAAKSHLIHENKAARLKSRVAKLSRGNK